MKAPDMTRYESKSLRPVGLNDVCHLPVANHRILKKYQFLTPGPCPHEISIKMNITLVELTFYLKINLWVQPLRNYSKGRKKSQLKTYSATFLRDVQANLLGVQDLVGKPGGGDWVAPWDKAGRHSKNGDTTNLTNQNEDIMGHTIIQPAHLYILGLKIGTPPSDHLNGKKI